MTATSTLSGRDRAILRAVAAGGAELQLGAEPDLFFDGRCDEAVEFYKRALGAKVAMLQRFKDSPDPARPVAVVRTPHSR